MSVAWEKQVFADDFKPVIGGSLDLASVGTSRMVWQGLAAGKPSAELLNC